MSEITVESLHERYATQIHAYLNQFVRNTDVADDLTQLVFIKAWQALPRLVPESNAKAWLYKIAENTAFDEGRMKGHRQGALPGHCPLEEGIATLLEDDGSEALFVQQQVRQVLSVLPEKERRILLLFYVCGFSMREIEKYDHISIATVKMRLLRARNRFMRIYRAMQEEEAA